MKNEFKSFVLLILYLILSVFSGKFVFESIVPNSSIISVLGTLYLPVTTILSAAVALLLGGFSIVVLFFKCLFSDKSKLKEFANKVEMVHPPRWPFFVLAVILASFPALFLKIFYSTSFIKAYFYIIFLGVTNAVVFILMAGRNWCYWLLAMWELGDIKTGEDYRHLHIMPDAQNQIEFAAPDKSQKSPNENQSPSSQ